MSEQHLETAGTSVAPPQRLRSQESAPQPQPLPGTTRQRVENRAHVKSGGEEPENDDGTDKTDEEDEEGSVADRDDHEHSSNSNSNDDNANDDNANDDNDDANE